MYKSATDPLETITSGEEIILLKKTGVACQGDDFGEDRLSHDN